MANIKKTWCSSIIFLLYENANKLFVFRNAMIKRCSSIVIIISCSRSCSITTPVDSLSNIQNIHHDWVIWSVWVIWDNWASWVIYVDWGSWVTYTNWVILAHGHVPDHAPSFDADIGQIQFFPAVQSQQFKCWTDTSLCSWRLKYCSIGSWVRLTDPELW